MKTFKRFLVCSAQPKTLIISCCSVLLGLTVSLIQGGVSLFPAFLTLTFAVLLQISANLFYEYFEGVRQLSRSRKGNNLASQTHLLSDANVRFLKVVANGFAILAATAGLPLFTFIGWVGVAYVAVIVVVLYFDLSGPYPLMATPFSLLVTFFMFGPVAVSGNSLIQHSIYSNWIPVFVYSVVSGLVACNVHIAMQYGTLQEDMEAGKQSLLIAAGFRVAKFLYLLNSVVVAVILSARPCVINSVSKWFAMSLGVAVLVSSLWAIRFMGRNSSGNARKIRNIALAQYLILSIVIMSVVACSLDSFHLNILHLI